jgi:hypothetical protein
MDRFTHNKKSGRDPAGMGNGNTPARGGKYVESQNVPGTGWELPKPRRFRVWSRCLRPFSAAGECGRQAPWVQFSLTERARP